MNKTYIRSHGPCCQTTWGLINTKSMYVTLPAPWYSSEMFRLCIKWLFIFPTLWQCLHRNVHIPYQFPSKKYVFLGGAIIHLQLWIHDSDSRIACWFACQWDRGNDGRYHSWEDVCYRTVAGESCDWLRPSKTPVTFTWPGVPDWALLFMVNVMHGKKHCHLTPKEGD